LRCDSQNIRIIPRLDIKGPNLVKGIHLEGLRIIGKPEKFARYYYENGADELLYMDAVASLYGRNSLDEIIAKTSQEIFIPLTVGGGLRTIKDIRRVLSVGADKVSLNTAAIRDPHLIKEAAHEFGSSTIVISIEALKMPDNTYEAFTECGRESTGINVIEWAKQVVDLGAGEIIITSIDQEGTGLGFDLELTRFISEAVSIPVIACGGAGTKEHIYQAITVGKADAVSAASLLHYNYLKHHDVNDDFSSEGNIEFLKSKREFQIIEDASLFEIKKFIHNQRIGCRFQEVVEADG